MSNAVSTWVIAGAAVANVLVYLGLWLETRKQSIQTREMFLEAHKPALVGSIRECEYSDGETFAGQIAIANHGTAIAHHVSLRLSFATVGFNGVKDIGPLAIQPHSKVKQPFCFSMKPDVYKVADTNGNRLTVLTQGSYSGIGDSKYAYNERQEYHLTHSGFVPVWAE